MSEVKERKLPPQFGGRSANNEEQQQSQDPLKPFVVSSPNTDREAAFLVRTSREMHAEVKRIAAAHGLSINELTIQMIDYCLKQMAPSRGCDP